MSSRPLTVDEDQRNGCPDRDRGAHTAPTQEDFSGGWPSMAAQVREYDEVKVKDTKEDVDTLLVSVRSRVRP